MRVPFSLTHAFEDDFERRMAEFAVRRGLLSSIDELRSSRFLSRSVVPHVIRLSQAFNRLDSEDLAQSAPLETRDYWKESSNPKNLRLAYFLTFMPLNLYRMAAVWAELGRLGWRWTKTRPMKGIEFGAGPCAGAAGIASGETHARTGLPQSGDWALIEKDKAMLKLGEAWLETHFSAEGVPDWSTRSYHRSIDLKRGFLPRNAPRFDLWLMSFFLNELDVEPRELAAALIEGWSRHLEEDGIAILVEPALRGQSRRLLEVRREILRIIEKKKIDDLRILLPCLGHQACGALVKEQDWCHESVTWWRPPYLRRIDDMTSLDHKTLAFSYLVVARSKRGMTEILPALAGSRTRHRLVSPSHTVGQGMEFYTCGEDGKKRVFYRPDTQGPAPERGDIAIDASIRGDAEASRLENLRGFVGSGDAPSSE